MSYKIIVISIIYMIFLHPLFYMIFKVIVRCFLFFSYLDIIIIVFNNFFLNYQSSLKLCAKYIY
jgi:hypothetical protein